MKGPRPIFEGRVCTLGRLVLERRPVLASSSARDSR